MNFLKHYYEQIVTYDLLNKFQYQNIKQLPKLQKIILYFTFKKFNINDLISALMLLEFISFKKSIILKSNKFNAVLKIKKGTPIGCKVILTKRFMYLFLTKLIMNIFPNLKELLIFNVNNKNFKTLSFKIENVMIFKELEQNYKFFKNLSNLHIVLITNSNTFKEFLFLLKSFKIFIQ